MRRRAPFPPGSTVLAHSASFCLRTLNANAERLAIPQGLEQRRGWDSNPRNRANLLNGFQDRRLQPLGHLSRTAARAGRTPARSPASRRFATAARRRGPLAWRGDLVALRHTDPVRIGPDRDQSTRHGPRLRKTAVTATDACAPASHLDLTTAVRRVQRFAALGTPARVRSEVGTLTSHVERKPTGLRTRLRTSASSGLRRDESGFAKAAPREPGRF